MFKKFVIPAVMVTGLFVATACGRDQNQGALPGDMLATHLKLSEEQQRTVHTIFKKHRPALASKMEAAMQARNTAMDTALDPSVPYETWRTEQEKAIWAMADLGREVRAAYVEALPVLTESQRTEAKAVLKNIYGRLDGMQDRHQMMALTFVKNRLELTDDQVVTIKQIIERHRPTLEQRRKAVRDAMEPVFDAASDPLTPPSEFDKHQATVKDTSLALSAEVRAIYLEIAAHLSPDQRAAAVELTHDFRNAVDAVRKLVLGF